MWLHISQRIVMWLHITKVTNTVKNERNLSNFQETGRETRGGREELESPLEQ